MKKITSILFGILISTTLTFADQLEDIQKKGTIKVGVKNDFDPFGFVSSDGKIIGFDIDLAEAISAQLGVKLELVVVTSGNRIDYLLQNKIDIIAASMTHKSERDKSIDFTISYFYDGQSILAKNTSTASSYKDFIGKKVGAVTGASSGKVFEVVQPLSEVIYFKTYDEAIAALAKGTVDCLTSDYAFLATKAKKSNGDFKTIGRPFTVEPYGIGLRENESNLRDELNTAIQKMVKNGEYDKMYKKWFGKNPSQKPILWP